MRKSASLSTFSVLSGLCLITLAIVLYAQGYRLDLTRGAVEKTGIILAKSAPEGAKVRLDDELVAVTNSSISNLKPGTYHLKIEKDGYFSWEKNVPVEEGFVTNVTVLLPPLSPSLTTVTQKGVRLVTRAPSGGKAAFVSGSGTDEAELYLLNLTSPALGFLRTTPQKIAGESEEFPLSEAITLRWSPNEDKILVTAGAQYYLISVTGKNGQPTLVQDATDLLAEWDLTQADQKATLIKGSDLEEGLAMEAVKPTTIWAPDERKFLYEKKLAPSEGEVGRRLFWVADLSDPLQTGDKAHQLVWETESEALKLFWLAGSHHFVMVENGMISLLDLDGSNKRDLFQGTLAEEIALSTTDLSKIIVVTSLAPEAPPNLYAISLK